jgi:hypothetical protein
VSVYIISAGVRVTILFDLYREPMEDDGEQFENKMKGDYPIASAGILMEEEQAEKIRGGIDALLSGGRPAVAVCLSHKYPLCQASRDFLKGGDRALYDFLCRHYSVEISAIVIESSRNLDYSQYDRISAGRFVEKDGDDAAKKVAVAGNKKATGKKAAAAQEKVLLLIPTAVGKNIIHEVGYIEHTGNESQDEELTYLATAVIITNTNNNKKK